MSALLEGVREFQKNIYPEKKSQFLSLADGQSPRALFITCSDSRINPNLLTSTEPGELFVIRNAGNIVPEPHDQQEGVLASIEYAVSVLNVPEIIVCGHSRCGAMSGLLSLESVESMPFVHNWLQHSKPAIDSVRQRPASGDAVWDLALENVRLQLQRLDALPFVAERVAETSLTVFGWCYQFETGGIHVLNRETDRFEPFNRDEYATT